ncbi:MAG: penicillin-binding protein 2 [Nitrospirae bacterium]|nr:penicillin-binding protein 2 [Nitrospirota bacterium]
MKRRPVFICTVIIFAFLAVVLRLADIMILNHERFLKKARLQHNVIKDIPVKRGLIFDRNGRELALNTDTESIYCIPSVIASHDESINAISKAIGQSAESLRPKLDTSKKFAWIKRKVSIEEGRLIKKMNIKGVDSRHEAKRVYPKGRIAAHLIGFVDIDNKGLEGLELKYNQYLFAVGEKTSVKRDARGKTLSDGQLMERIGNNLILTLDEGMQHIVERRLDEAMRKWRASAATVIIMDPYTGEILSMANRPSFDPNNPTSASSDEKRNRAVTDCYEPGSTFKIIGAAAALEEGAATLNKRFDCSAGYIEVGGKKIKDAHRHGILTFKEVIQKSSNVGAVKIGMLLGSERLFSYIKRFGIGDPTGIDLAGEAACLIRGTDKWSKMSIGAVSIGQEVSVTPLQVLRAYSAVANGGSLVKPFVVSEIVSQTGASVYKAVRENKRILSSKTVNILKDILETVTEEGGTAKKASVDGNRAAGKTGTSQVFDPRIKRYSKEKYVSSFVGFVPSQEPSFAMIVVINEPKGAIYGGDVAAPLFRQIASDALSYLNVPREDSDKRGLTLASKLN